MRVHVHFSKDPVSIQALCGATDVVIASHRRQRVTCPECVRRLLDHGDIASSRLEGDDRRNSGGA